MKNKTDRKTISVDGDTHMRLAFVAFHTKTPTADRLRKFSEREYARVIKKLSIAQ